jgi:ssDNA-binding Zn-finger/Zn-ribbon topoisomerase 1
MRHKDKILMAKFEGTIKEFTRYIGPYTRIKVSQIASKYKKELGKCEECGTSASLDAAHVRGKERPLLIANILSEFLEDEIIKVDINEFVPRFIEAHLPIESSIRILCKECHREYDRIIKNNTNKKEKNIDESDLIEKIVHGQMNKAKAITLAHQEHLMTITNSNSIFSNIVSNLDRWWLEPSNDKFRSELYIILNNSLSTTLYIFQIPPNAITDPTIHFKQRNDNYRHNCSDIYIPVSNSDFIEQNGFDFGKYLKEKISY